MKKIIILALCFALAQFSLQAQTFNWGIKLGLSTPDVKPADFNPVKIINRGADSLLLRISDSDYGYHGGLWARVKFGRFMIQPEVVFNTSSVTYKLTSLSRNPANTLDSVRKESFKNIDIPVMFGVKTGSLRLNAGPVGHISIGSSSDLTNVSGYTSKFQTITFGYQAGIGLDFGALGIDIRYEGNFTNFGDHLVFGGTKYNFSNTPSRLLVSMAIGF